MSFVAQLRRAREALRQEGRLSLRGLARELEIEGEQLDEIIEELVDVQQVARRDGRALVWVGGQPAATPAPDASASAENAAHSHAAHDAEARKVVTVVFADLAGSTSLHERLDAESTRRLMDRYYRALRDAVEGHGGTVVKLMGDGVMAAFGVPRVAEDDAIRAVRAAVGMQQAFRELVHEQSATVGDIGLRVAVNSGEVIVSAANDDVVGDPVNVAARLQQEARDGDVVIGESTRRIVSELVTLAPLGALTLKGRSETVAAYRVVSLERPAGAAATTFVGRADELRRIMAVYDAAVAAPAARLAVILGSPGLGKSRLLDEFGRRLEDGATMLTAHCEAGGGATFAPIAKALRALLRIDEGTISDAMRAPTGESTPGPVQVPLLSKEGSGEVGTPAALPPPGPLLGKEGEALRTAIAAAMPNEADYARIADGIAALLAGTPAAPEETFFIVRRFLAALAATKPVVLAIDDLQWAEPLLLDLVEHLVQWGTGMPLLLLAAARPELRDTRSALTAAGGVVADVVTLAGLDAVAASRLAANVIGAEALPAAVAGRVLASSEGNPLFLGELVRMLVDDGALKREGDRWTAGVDLAALDMPPTIHALLAARIERLRADDRLVLERAAIVGRQFSRAAVAHLLPREAQGDLDARLEALRRSEFIEPDPSWFLGEPALRFHHGLTRDAAYRRVLKGTRAELHARFAEWIEGKVGDVIEHNETIGWHLEQAHQHLRELGPIDAEGRALGERAARYLAAAGRRALARDDVSPASTLLGRAFNLLDAADPTRADLALDWCEALLSAGDVGTAAKAIDELGRFTIRQAAHEHAPAPSPGALPRADGLPPFQGSEPAANAEGQQPQRGGQPIGRGTAPGVGEQPSDARSSRLRAWHTCFTGQLAVLTDPQALRATADAVAAAAEALAAVDDAAGEAKAHAVHAAALVRLGRVGACEAALDRALAAARKADDRRRSNAVLAGAPLAALWGPSPVTRASGRCLDVVRVLRITQGAPAVEAVALRCQAVLEALRGRTEAARRMIASSRRMVEELGITQQLLEADAAAGLIELLEGDAAAAERNLRTAYEGLRVHGLGIDAAQAGALLGRALLAEGRAAEAEELSHEIEALAGDDLKAAIAWRGVRAEALAKRGEHGAAVDLARAAVDIAAATDALLDHADARLALAAALRAASKSGEAAAEEARAIELWQAKGATLLAERARESQPVRHARNLPAGIQEGRVDSRLVTAGMTEENPSLAPLAKGRTKEGSLAAAPPIQRRVRPNAATANVERLDAAAAARDAAALAAVFADSCDATEHHTGATNPLELQLQDWHLFFSTKHTTYRQELLASLGESLALCRQSWSASAAAFEGFDTGAWEIENIFLIEVDAQGRRCRTEVFAVDHLGDAIARLYERYAELLPGGPERERAAAMARLVVVWTTTGFDADSIGAWFAPAAEFVDHRRLGFEPMRGREAIVVFLRSMSETTRDSALRFDDILGLQPGVSGFRATNFGTLLAGGGTFERSLLMISVHGRDGLVTRAELFDSDSEAAALARFDELFLRSATREGEPPGEPLAESRGSAGASPSQTGPSPRPTEKRARRLRANAATDDAARFEATLVARDLGALADQSADDLEMIDHTTGATFDRGGVLDSFRWALKARDLTCRGEALAALGEALALCRLTTAADRFADGGLDVGIYEREQIFLLEVDGAGRRRRFEVFASDRLGDAVARLYARYAELLPDGPERDRAAVTAQASTGWIRWRDLTLAQVDSIRAFMAPAIEFVDRRRLGFEPTRGIDALVALLRSLSETTRVSAVRVDDVLALEPTGLLVRETNFGTDRASGGAFERQYLAFSLFGVDGRTTRIEVFEADREDEALARFDELVGDSGERRTVTATAHIDTTATRSIQRMAEPWNAGDWDRYAAFYTPDFRLIDRRTLINLELDRDQYLQGARLTWDMRSSRLTSEVIATRGDRLLLQLTRHVVADADVGPSEREYLVIIEVDDRGHHVAMVLFDAGDLDAAYTELDRRFAAGEAAPYTRAWEMRGRLLHAMAARDWDGFTSVALPDLVVEDHRPIGAGTLSREEWVAIVRAMAELRPDAVLRQDHVLAMNDRGTLAVSHWAGDETGGQFEIPSINSVALAADGRVRRVDVYSLDQLDEARARFAELTAAPPVLGIANAGTRSLKRWEAALEARDWDTVATLYAPGFWQSDRRRLVLLELDRRQALESLRAMWDMRSFRLTEEVLATRGDRLALAMARVEVADGDMGPSEREILTLVEVDERGERVLNVLFDPDALDAAYDELDERYAAGEAAPYAAIWNVHLRNARGMTARDWEQLTTLYAPDCVLKDHRPLGLPTLRSGDECVASIRAFVELRPDARVRVEHVLRLADRRTLTVSGWRGSETEGAFEIPAIALTGFDSSGHIERVDLYNLDQLDEARARFAELTAVPLALRIENAATRSIEQVEAAWKARGDWDRLAGAYAPGFRQDDRRRLILLELDRRQALEGLRAAWDMRSLRLTSEVLATRGDQLALARALVEVAGGDVGPSERELLYLIQVDGRGERVLAVLFDADDLDAAYAELDQRYAEGEAAPYAAAWEGYLHHVRTIAAQDWEQLSAAFAPDCVLEDHRLLGLPTLRSRDECVAAVRAFVELRPDARSRTPHVLALTDRWALTVTAWMGSEAEGAFEIPAVAVTGFDLSGHTERLDLYDLDQLDEARALFDKRTAQRVMHPSGSPVGKGRTKEGSARRLRRVRPNAATANAARMDAAIGARDGAAIDAVFAAAAEITENPTGATYDRRGVAAIQRSVLAAQNPTCRSEPLATLGNSLALCHMSISAVGFADEQFDVGSYEHDGFVLIGVDDQGRRRLSETFDIDRLGDAIARLYERYAELLPEGPARVRAAATTRAVAAMTGPMDAERRRGAFAPDIEVVDHRTLGMWTARGTVELQQGYRSWVDLVHDATEREDDILCLRFDAALVRRTFFGTDRAGGGAFERRSISLWVFGADGRVARWELFDTDRDEEALARFDELTAPGEGEGDKHEAPLKQPRPMLPPGGERPKRSGPRIENAATQSLARMEAAWEARDWDTVAALYAPGFWQSDRRRLILLELDRRQSIEGLRATWDMRSSRLTSEVLATRGDRLALARVLVEVADADMGPSEREVLTLVEVDARGQRVLNVLFDPDAVYAAYAELDRRYGAGEAAPYAASWERYLRNLRAIAARDWKEVAAGYAPDCVMEDHRPLGLPTLRSRAECVASTRAFVELRPDATLRADHVLALDGRRLLSVTGWVGSEPEGRFEIPVVVVSMLDPDGTRSVHLYNLDQLDAAWARFAAMGGSRFSPRQPLDTAPEKTGPTRGERISRSLSGIPEPFTPSSVGSGQLAKPASLDTAPKAGAYSGRTDMPVPRIEGDPLRIPPNAATRTGDRLGQAREVGDWSTFDALCAPALEFDDRRRGILLRGDRGMFIRGEQLMGASRTRLSPTVLATAGDRLVLEHLRWTGPGEAVDFEVENLSLTEVDAEGRIIAVISFDADDRRAASMEMLERYARSDEARCIPAVVFEGLRAVNAHDLDRVRATMPDDFVLNDHRRTGLGRLGGKEYLASLAALFEQAPDVTVETLYIIAVEEHGILLVARNFGTLREGGEFESVYVRIHRVVGVEVFEVEMVEIEDLDVARARFAERR